VTSSAQGRVSVAGNHGNFYPATAARLFISDIMTVYRAVEM